MPETKLMNMCMIHDPQTNRVVVQDKISTTWGGITFPGGHIENGESIIASTIREVYEETGLHVNNLKSVGLVNWCNIETQERWLIFLFKTSDYSGILLDETHEGKVFWVDFSDIDSMNLAPDMPTYLKLFTDETLNEAFGRWEKSTYSDLELV